MTVTETMHAIVERARQLSDEQHTLLSRPLEPLIAAEACGCSLPRIWTTRRGGSSRTTSTGCSFRVTPLAIDPASFPAPRQRTRCWSSPLGVRPVTVAGHDALGSAIPAQILPRFVALPCRRHTGSTRSSCRGRDSPESPPAYHGYAIASSQADRVTRDADLEVATGRGVDLLTSIEQSLRERRMGSAVRLQYESHLPPAVLATLVDELELTSDDLYEAQGFIAFADLFQLYAAVDLPRLKDKPLQPTRATVRDGPDVERDLSGDVLSLTLSDSTR